MKIVWIREKSISGMYYLTARCSYDDFHEDAVTTTGLRDIHMDPVQDWCVANHCGIRTSFDTFKFHTEKDMTLFLLRWS